MAAEATKTKRPAKTETFYGPLSIKAIGERLQIDRAIVKKRLDQHMITPLHSETTLKLYQFDEALEALLLEQDTKLTEAKTRKELAMAEEREIKVRILRDEMASVSEFTEYLALFAGGLYKDICVRLPKRIASRLAKATTAADCEALLFGEINKEFQAARENHAKYFPKEGAVKAA